MIGKGAVDFNMESKKNTVICCIFDGIGDSAEQIGDEGTTETIYAQDTHAIANNKKEMIHILQFLIQVHGLATTISMTI